jgi:hypothetical protein
MAVESVSPSRAAAGEYCARGEAEEWRPRRRNRSPYGRGGVFEFGFELFFKSASTLTTSRPNQGERSIFLGVAQMPRPRAQLRRHLTVEHWG